MYISCTESGEIPQLWIWLGFGAHLQHEHTQSLTVSFLTLETLPSVIQLWEPTLETSVHGFLAKRKEGGGILLIQFLTWLLYIHTSIHKVSKKTHYYDCFKVIPNPYLPLNISPHIVYNFTGPFQPRSPATLEILLIQPMFLPSKHSNNHINHHITKGEHSTHEGKCPEKTCPNLEVPNIINLMKLAQFWSFPTFSVETCPHTMLPMQLDVPWE